MTTAIVTPIADRLRDVLAALSVEPRVTPYRWAPSALMGTGPFAVIDIPRITRTGLDAPESEIGSWDWVLTYPVTLYVDLKEADRDQSRIVDLVEAFVAAIDDNPILRNPADPADLNGDPQIMDSKVVTADPILDSVNAARPLLGYECEVQILKHVPVTA